MKKEILIFLICTLSCFKLFAQEEIHIVLFAGQSNMAGQGIVSNLSKQDIKRIDNISDRVLISTSTNSIKNVKPLSFYVSKGENKFGPELFVGLTLAEKNPNQKYLFIKKAVGGTSLYGAWNSNWSKEKADLAEKNPEKKKMKLFSEHIKIINSNLEELKGTNYKILGLLWMQGESDTNKEITASSYQQNLEDLIAAYRKELDLKKLPFIIGQINVLPRKYKKGPEQVRNAMDSITRVDKFVEIVKTSLDPKWLDYPKHSDNLHYNTEGQKKLGIEFTKKLTSLLN
ncbi:protein of unknown function [Polaribacter sp. KT25b]|uniref:sialate O-acetylesterase n=1 Tax=Polaribacter sp. KT25b TaxID=1855336 RepID=UPI00087DC2E1|nr:sialate O-acetylesterase [Polaribacter sp. KT25b]SDR70217.1 protein of unknown function [Polaribacter sp. KT25b]